MARNPRVYMAGPIQHAGDHGKGWRERVKQRYDDIEWVDPIDKYDSTDEAAEWESEKIVEEDIKLINSCDALLVHWEEVATCGTPMEIRHAFERSMPIVVQTTVPQDDLSPWLTYHVTAIHQSFRTTISALKDILAGPYPQFREQ